MIGGSLLLSFDTAVSLPGVSTVAEPEDLVSYTDNGTFESQLYFDGSAAGVPPALNLDGVYPIDANGHLLLSFDGSGSVSNPIFSGFPLAVDFNANDVLEYDPAAHTWELAYQGAAAPNNWPAGADLKALFAIVAPTPTPSFTKTPVPTLTPTPTETPVPTDTPVPSATFTRSATATEVPTHTPVPTATAQPTATMVPTDTASPTRVPSFTPTATAGPSATPIPSNTPTPTTSVAPSATPTGTQPSPTATASPTVGITCVGDCDGNGEVTIDELITMVNIALENTAVTACPAGDANQDGAVTIDEIVIAVNHALGSC